jgi:hypothetical protein
LQLLHWLFDLGLIPKGRFSWVDVRHDWYCAALASGGSALDCRCNPEVEIGGHLYSFADLVEPGATQ